MPPACPPYDRGMTGVLPLSSLAPIKVKLTVAQPSVRYPSYGVAADQRVICTEPLTFTVTVVVPASIGTAALLLIGAAAIA